MIEEMTKVGKEITINIKIVDSDLASKLLATMYGKNIEELGVEVTSWGFSDITKAERERLEAIELEINSSHARLKKLMELDK